MIFGACVYLFRHYVVNSLVCTSPSHLSFALKSAEFVDHWFCIALPIAPSLRRFGG